MRKLHWAAALGAGAASLVSGCTVHHSKQALWAGVDEPPSAQATLVTEEDRGLALLSLFEVAEPDHHSVLLERARRRYACQRLHHPQLDFYTEYWVLVAFPVARVTLVCDTATPVPEPARPAILPQPAPAGSVTPWQPYPDLAEPGSPVVLPQAAPAGSATPWQPYPDSAGPSAPAAPTDGGTATEPSPAGQSAAEGAEH